MRILINKTTLKLTIFFLLDLSF